MPIVRAFCFLAISAIVGAMFVSRVVSRFVVTKIMSGFVVFCSICLRSVSRVCLVFLVINIFRWAWVVLKCCWQVQMAIVWVLAMFILVSWVIVLLPVLPMPMAMILRWPVVWKPSAGP